MLLGQYPGGDPRYKYWPRREKSENVYAKNLKIDSGQGETMSNILERILHETTRGYASKLASERKVVIWTYLVFCHIFSSQQIDRQTTKTEKEWKDTKWRVK